MIARAPSSLDRTSLNRLYGRLERPVYNVVYRWVWNEEEAQDIVQEAFVRLWRMRARVDMATVDALVYRIALNLASNRRRRKKLWQWATLGLLDSGRPGADEELAGHRRRRQVRDAVERLPDELRQVVMLCSFSEFSYAEVASVLDIPAGTVGSRRNRALQLLREELTDER